LRITVFFSIFLVLVAALLAIKGMNLAGDVFSGQPHEINRRISFLPPYDLAAKKIQHALVKSRFDVGIFGNSRIIAVGTSALDVGNQSIFNFAVPGTSMRQSINLLEKLETEGKAPKLSIISFDNMEFGYYANAYYPHALWRWASAFKDIIWIVSNRTGDIVLLAHVILDHLYTEWDALTDTWNFNALWTRAAAQFPDLVPPFAEPRGGYSLDGSRAYTHRPNLEIKRFERTKERMILLPHYLERDMERLRTLHRSGTKFVIFESHLEPDSLAFTNADPVPVVEQQRGRFKSICRRFGLICYTASELPIPAISSHWNDCCHAPSEALGQLVSELVRRHMQP
jgi:hypothetical protein